MSPQLLLQILHAAIMIEDPFLCVEIDLSVDDLAVVDLAEPYGPAPAGGPDKKAGLRAFLQPF